MADVLMALSAKWHRIPVALQIALKIDLPEIMSARCTVADKHGITGNLKLCTERDWFRFAVPPSEGEGRVSVKVSAGFQPEGTNLELALYSDDFVPGQRALAEAETDNQPEVLIVDDLEPGNYVLEVSSFRALGAPVEAVNYDLKIEISEYGFCDVDADCDVAFICAEGLCLEDPDPCAGQCGPLEICEPDTRQCQARCEPDQFGGNNTERDTAQFINTGRIEGLTICDGESDWYRLPIQEATKLVVELNGQGDPAENDVQLELWSTDQDLNLVNPEDPPIEPLARSAFVDQLNERVEYRFQAADNRAHSCLRANQASYTLTTTVGEPCAFDWDCCPVGVLECNRRCDPVRQVCTARVCGVDFQCDAARVQRSAHRVRAS